MLSFNDRNSVRIRYSTIRIPYIHICQYLNCYAIGIAFAFGWSPCIGPILGSVLAIAINSSVNGAILLSFYSFGLAIPFMIVGLLMGKLTFMIKGLNKYIGYFKFTTGLILLITGVLIFNGSIQSLGFRLNDILPSLEMILI